MLRRLFPFYFTFTAAMAPFFIGWLVWLAVDVDSARQFFLNIIR